MRTVLWIDDSETTLLLSRTVLESVGYHVLTAVSAWQGLNLLTALQVDVVIVDYEMPEMDGARLAMEIRRRKLAVPVVMVSGCVAFPGAALRCVNRFVSKGDGPRALIECLQSLIPEDSDAASRRHRWREGQHAECVSREGDIRKRRPYGNG